MKKVILTGKQICLLLKVEKSGYSFYSNVGEFLEENQNLKKEEKNEIEVEDDEFLDIIEMVSGYIEDDQLNVEDTPTEEEVDELKKLILQLNLLKEPSGSVEEVTEDVAEKTEETGEDVNEKNTEE